MILSPTFIFNFHTNSSVDILPRYMWDKDTVQPRILSGADPGFPVGGGGRQPSLEGAPTSDTGTFR